MKCGQGPIKRDYQEPEPASMRDCEDDEIEPLTGEPYFHVLLQKSHVHSPYQLAVPARFSCQLPSEVIPVTLTRGSRSWEMTYFGNHPTHKKFDQTWRTFVVDNKLEVGDACVFELVNRSSNGIKLKVQILRGDFPSELLARQDGTSDRPVVIDED